MARVTGIARLVGWAGLTGAGVLHAIWASGSSWPEKNSKRLSKAVVGSAKGLPDADATWGVAAAAVAGGAIAAGGLGEGRAVVGLRRLMGLGLLTRAAVGGDAALAALGLPEPGKRFRELDRRWYRPLFGVLGIALLIGAKK
ncbi:DUF3995 domain-containing protein [Leucobacter massiliensis]|uniref:DUF3995 domain-containing protein n=1 Tax=Leucobacter massiliensis TaxID=1686285 RepID=A0A2S9QPZ1_9MICO|nr:DUF3995 domain-containing protein [Leucobacter massiliensis]PRI11642.1 hypothetical protein B4915_05940 [Leucobacter massiliensis]